MLRFAFALLLLVACRPVVAPAGELAPAGDAAHAAPVAPRESTRTELHGIVLEDPYAWLRNRDDPRTRAYLEAENEYGAAVMAPTRRLQAQLFDEMVARIVEDDTSVPYLDGPYVYSVRTRKGLDYGLHCRRPRDRAADPSAEQIVLDENALAAGHEFFDLGAFEPSPDHERIVVGTDTVGDEHYTLKILDTSDGSWRADIIDNTSGQVEWFADGNSFLYVELDDASRAWRVRRHRLGAPTAEDAIVHDEPDARFGVGVSKTRGERFIVIHSASQVTGESRILDALRPDEAPRLVTPRRTGVEYSIAHHGGWLYKLTNEGALNFKIVRTKVDALGRDSWEDWLAHDPSVFLTNIDTFADHLVISQRREGLSELVVVEAVGGARHTITQPEPSYTVHVDVNRELKTTKLRFAYASMVTPWSTFEYDMKTRERTLLKETPVNGFDKAQYVSERVMAPASDGTRVPVSLVYRAPLVRDGTAPLLLTGYGAYGVVNDASFSIPRLALLDRGVVFAIAHIRGGGDLGRGWYEDGKLAKKTNSFTDFIACAEHLIAQGWTSPKRLAIQGGSAGGLLIGAVLNMRPELFGAAVADVPFVDVVNTMLDASLPLTAGEWDEWGDPRTPEGLVRLRAYSPYDNVAAQDYPPMLVLGGWADPRVGYWEPAKWVARLRTKKTDDNPLLLFTEMNAGHGGASGRYGALRDVARSHAFVLDTVARP